MSEERDSKSPRIHVLPSDLIHRIAAGEVVDRPASALKELLENSIDSGAHAIRVQIVEGGLKRIEVEDDGCGFGLKNLEVAAQRHATSKISSIEDLDQIFTLGFRGEALSAISSVSKMSIDSKLASSDEPAYLLQIIGGSKKAIVPGVRKVGSKITVDDLFFNVPARKKFLSKASSEAKECQSVLEKVALAHPELSFEAYIVNADGEIKNHLSLKATDFLSRFQDVMQVKGQPLTLTAKDLLPGFHRLEVHLFPPPAAHGNQKKIYLSVNGRSLFDKRLPYSLRESFAGLIEIGQFPLAHVVVEVDPEKIDVNVHPQKKEIRWPTDVSLAGMVFRLVRPQFELKTSESSQAVSVPFDFGYSSPSASDSESTLLPTPQSVAELLPKISTPTLSTTPILPAAPRNAMRFSSFRVVGEVGAAWIVCESEQGMVIIDQHAAHERINFEKILKQSDLWEAKPLLVPVELKIPYFLSDKLSQITQALESLGFEMSDENFEQKILILAVPSPARTLDWEKMLEKIFNRLEQDLSLDSLLSELKSELAASLACHGSIRRGQRLANEQIVELLQQMDSVDWGGFCPHGRPVWFLLGHDKIEATFHR